jgi:hypothetical protein
MADPKAFEIHRSWKEEVLSSTGTDPLLVLSHANGLPNLAVTEMTYLHSMLEAIHDFVSKSRSQCDLKGWNSNPRSRFSALSALPVAITAKLKSPEVDIAPPLYKTPDSEEIQLMGTSGGFEATRWFRIDWEAERLYFQPDPTVQDLQINPADIRPQAAVSPSK